jgi:hypothetical protein
MPLSLWCFKGWRIKFDGRKKVEARAAELIAEEMTLRELWHARKLTQDSVSRLDEEGE